MTMELGKAKYSSEKKEVFKIKDGDNVFRVLPPMGKLAKAGVYSRYYRVVWGYKDTKGSNRPFVSPRVQNFQTKMIDVDCAAFNRSEKLKTLKDDAIKQAKDFAKKGQPLPEALKEKIEDLKDQVKRFNIDSKNHMNAMDPQGKIGLLKLAGRGFTALKQVFKDLESKGVDATGVEGGRFMVINRTGSALDTAYAVREYKEQVQTAEYGLVEKPVPHSLTPAIISRLEAEAFQLDEIYPTPSSKQVQLIVEAFERSEAEGAKVLEEILGTKAASVTDDSGNDGEAPSTTEAKTEAAKELVQPNTTEKMAELNEPVKAETKAEAPKEQAQSATSSALKSDADFLAELGLKF